ncbi:uncharacterized protein LOC127282823 [Leptopilina boulardi]|uniref:uncharacterized protein LOC127282823 n=1 Tax=Leptopilina boulardi TaxID=63433 RepID=UPI0021F55811|nr:uncharacterized protein LOC127282823 [Leptopilina boulardi]
MVPEGETWGISVSNFIIVASYGRRHFVDEVPGLYIRRLRLEDPKSARDRPHTGPPTKHSCHTSNNYFFSGRGTSSSYRSWLNQIRNERQAFLTIISLELPESSVPLIDASVPCKRIDENFVEKNNEIGNKELLERVTQVTDEKREKEKCVVSVEPVKKVRKARKQQGIKLLACTKRPATLEKCTRNIVKGIEQTETSEDEDDSDCICSKISENLRITLRKKTEVTRTPRDPSPEVTHTIRIAMKYHGQPECGLIDREEDEIRESANSNSEKSRKSMENDITKLLEEKPKENCCSNLNIALDFTLNCNSVQLTSRDISLRPVTKNQQTQNDFD